MAARVARSRRPTPLGELDEEGRGRLAVLRLRCARAAERARLADELADQVAGAPRAPQDPPSDPAFARS